MRQYLDILGSVIPLFLLMAVGAAVRRLGVLNAQGDRTLLNLTVRLLTPCLILDHVMANEALRRYDNLLASPLLGFLLTAACIGVAAAAVRFFCPGAGEAEWRTFAFTDGVFNYGYVALPLIAALYGPEALGVLFLFNLGVETAFWTIGFGLLERRSPLREWRRALTMPVRAILVAVAINLGTAAFGLRLDDATLAAHPWGWPVQVLASTIHLIGLCMIPLALLLIGATMADYWGEFRRAPGARIMTLAVLVRNVACPVGFVLPAWLLPLSPELKETLIVQAAMPAAVLPVLLARHHGGSVPVALQVVFSTSAAGVVTLPLWIHFGMRLAGGR